MKHDKSSIAGQDGNLHWVLRIMLAGNEQLMQVRGGVAGCVGARVPIKHRVVGEMLLAPNLIESIFKCASGISCTNICDSHCLVRVHRVLYLIFTFFTGPRGLWGPVYGSRCHSVRELWLTLLM